MRFQTSGVQNVVGELIRRRAEKLLCQAVEYEIEVWLEGYKGLKDEKGRQRVVRNGYLPERVVRTKLGQVTVSVPRSRDRNDISNGAKVQFNSNLLPPYLRRLNGSSDLLDALLLYSVAIGDFTECLIHLLGRQSAGLSPELIARLKEQWRVDWSHWQTRDISGKGYVRVHGEVVRYPGHSGCFLLALGIAESGRIDLLSLTMAKLPSESDWLEIARNLRRRGLGSNLSSASVTGDGAFVRALAASAGGYVRYSDPGAVSHYLGI